jgi:toxin-antitoxin system PIN domain toxin
LLVPDVNVLLNAHFSRQVQNAAALTWWELRTQGGEAVAIPNLVFSAFVRIATNGNLSPEAVSPSDAFEFCEHLRRLPVTMALQEGPRHWEIFRSVVLESGVSGSDIADAYLAAFALENDATFVTFDRGFRRFQDMKLLVLE